MFVGIADTFVVCFFSESDGSGVSLVTSFKWKSRIICVLSANEKLRYSELRREMYNITDAVLVATLKDLIEDGMIDRKSYDEIPPRVEYMLTEKGKSVVPILQNICQWSGVFYKEDVENEMTQCQKCDHHE